MSTDSSPAGGHGSRPGAADDAGDPVRLPPSHLRPRTREGWFATLSFVGLFLMAMPPVTHRVLDRPDVWLLGLPMLFVALLAVYCGLVLVLLWALRRGL